MYEDDDLGEIGESLIEAIAAQESITCTRPKRDKFGWDLHLEFKNPVSSLLLDSSDSCYSISLQVKAFKCCYSNYNGRNIKLSNVHHMLTSPLPCFYAFVDVNKKDIYLVHFWDSIIYNGLKSIRQAEAAGCELYKKKLTINPRTQNAIKVSKLNDTYNLKQCLLDIISMSPSEYTKEKQKIKENSGYENGYAKVSFHLDPKLISKLKYGLINTIEIDALNFTDIRFNIPLPTKNIPEKIEILSNDYAFELGLTDKRPGVKGELLFLDENDNSEVSLDGSLIIDGNNEMFIFKHRYFRLVIDNRCENKLISGEFLLSKLQREKLNIHEMEKLLLAVKAFFFSPLVKFEIYSGSDVFSFEHNNDETCYHEDSFGDNLADCLRFIPKFKWFMGVLNIDLSTLISIDELMIYEKNMKILLSQIYGDDVFTMRLSIDDDFFNNHVNEPFFCYVPVSVPIFGDMYLIFIEVRGVAEIFNNNYMYSTSAKISIKLQTKIRTGRNLKRFIDSIKPILAEAKKMGLMLMTYQALSAEHEAVFKEYIQLMAIEQK